MTPKANMSQGYARFCFTGELADLLTRAHESGSLRYPVDRAASIKDAMEAIGVPHTEVYAIRCGGRDRDFSLQLSPGMEVSFYPADLAGAQPVDVTRADPLRPALPRLSFLVDENSAGVVPLLRALGFDTLYDRNLDDARLARLAAEQQRVVISRDRGLLKRGCIHHGRLLRTQGTEKQLVEILNHFYIRDTTGLFSRCLECNTLTRPVDKADIIDRLEPKTRLHYHTFHLCPTCARLFWRGSHIEKLTVRLTDLGVDLAAFTPQQRGKTS